MLLYFLRFPPVRGAGDWDGDGDWDWDPPSVAIMCVFFVLFLLLLPVLSEELRAGSLPRCEDAVRLYGLHRHLAATR